MMDFVRTYLVSTEVQVRNDRARTCEGRFPPDIPLPGYPPEHSPSPGHPLPVARGTDIARHTTNDLGDIRPGMSYVAHYT